LPEGFAGGELNSVHESCPTSVSCWKCVAEVVIAVKPSNFNQVNLPLNIAIAVRWNVDGPSLIVGSSGN